MASILVKQADMPSVEGTAAYCCALNGEYLAVGHNSDPHLSLFYRSGGEWVRGIGTGVVGGSAVDKPLSTPQTLAWSPNGQYLVAGLASSPFLAFYKLDGTALKKQSVAETPPALRRGVSWFNDDFFLICGNATSVQSSIELYERSGDVITRRVEVIGSTKNHLDTWGDYAVIGVQGITPYYLIAKRNGASLDWITAPGALSGSARFVKWRKTGDYCVIGHQLAPYLTLLKRVGDTFTIIPWAGLPDAFALPNMAEWSPDGNYLVAGGGFAPRLRIYEFGLETFTAIEAPTPELLTSVTGVDWDSLGAVAVNGTVPRTHFYTVAATIPTVTGRIYAVTESPVAAIQAVASPHGLISVTTDSPISTFEGYVPVEGGFSAPTDDAIATLRGTFNWASGNIATTTDDAVATFVAFHDWTPAVNPYRDPKIFQLRLEAPGFDPLILDPTNISVRSTIEGRQSSITATIPTVEDVDAIALRASGNLIFAGGYLIRGEERFNDILALPLIDARPDEGTSNKSLTLTARGPSPASYPKTVTAADLEYRSINGLKRLVRLPVDINLAAGDTLVTPDGAAWTVGEAVYAIAADGGESMTVTEA